MALDYITFPDDLDRADYAMIGLHGRNANKYAFFPFVRQMGFLHTRWLLPSATFASDDAPDVRWWYDNDRRDPVEVQQSREEINALIDSQLTDGIAAENIFLVGFSQGAVMSVDTALRYPQRLGGIVSLSGYVIHPDFLREERHKANTRVPIFLAHGTRDQILSVETGRENQRVLEDMGYDVEYHEYDTAHRVSSQETRDIRAFLHRHMYGIDMDDPRKQDEHVVTF
ncbi:dienelactone hydrolase family protein [bacterium]|nr:dienelactone hydrolase family protein [bacterium]